MLIAALFSLAVNPASAQVSAESQAFFDSLKAGPVSSDPGVSWKQMGPGMSGNNYLMHFHPHRSKASVMFLGPNMGNSYRSSDYGTTFHDILDHDADTNPDNRGPVQIGMLDFSLSSKSFGLASSERVSDLWKTWDTGQTWKKISSLPDLNGSIIGTIAIHPTDRNVWIIGTGGANNVNFFELNAANPLGRMTSTEYSHVAQVHKTTDGGKTWTDITPSANILGPDAHIVKVVYDRDNPKYIYMATTDGFFRSANGGDSFQKYGDLNAPTTDPNQIDAIRSLDVFYDGSEPSYGIPTLFAIKQISYAIKSDGALKVKSGGVYKSTDRGATWSPIHGASWSKKGLYLNLTGSGIFTLKDSYRKDLAAGWFGTNPATARDDYATMPNSIMPNFTKVVVDPENKDNIYVINDYKAKAGHTMTAGTVWRTTDGGTKWHVAFRNGSAWQGTDAEFWNERQLGNTGHNVTWRSMAHWKEQFPYFHKSGSALGFSADGEYLFLQAAKVLFRSSDGGVNWTEWDDRESTLYPGKYLSAGNSNLPGRDFVQDPRQPNILYFGTGENDLWVADTTQLENGEQTVSRVKVASPTDTGQTSVSAIAKDPNPSKLNRIFTLHFRQDHSGALMRSTNNTYTPTFSKVGDAIKQMPNGSGGYELGWEGSMSEEAVHQNNLIIHPDYLNNKTMYFNVPYHGRDLNYVGDSVTGVGLYKSTDGGVNWDKVDAKDGLPVNTFLGEHHKTEGFKSTNVTKVIMHPTRPDVVFVTVYDKRTSGAEGGLFMWDQSQNLWQRIDLPRNIKSAIDIVFDDAGRMYVSTGSYTATGNKGGIFWTPIFHTTGTKTWTPVFEMPFTGQIAVHHTDQNILLATVMPTKEGNVTHGNPGVYLSQDRGLSWKKINTGIGRSDSINDVAIDLNNKNVFYVSTWGSGHFRGTFTN